MKKILFLYIIICPVFIKAQTTDIIKPSINGTQFMSGVLNGNSLRSGQVTADIPLFTLQGKGINIPISLVFNPDGINHESESSHIGLGWSLMAGGAITATIRGADDNNITGNNKVVWQSDHNYLTKQRELTTSQPGRFVQAMNEIKGYDPAPDSYDYSFLGYSGSICFLYDFDRTNKITKFYPDEKFKLEKTNLGYKIIGDDGTAYFFESQESNKARQDLITTCWFLTKIQTTQGGVATFEYADESFEGLTHALYGLGPEIRYATVNSKRLSRINSDFWSCII